ncbi:MAG: peptide deformylase [Pseudomonadota bacterium]
MAVRKIIRMGHPMLREVARELTAEEIASESVRRLVDDMIDTLHDYGGIGLAAPQIAEPLRLAIVELPGGPSRYGELPELPLTVFVNPVIDVLDEAAAGYWEGCLSVPGLRGFVERPQHIRVRALDLDGQPLEMVFQGFPATVFQHEFDHLDGRLYVDRITDPTRLVFEEEFERYVLPVELDRDADQAG